jgi:hypothetical protein
MVPHRASPGGHRAQHHPPAADATGASSNDVVDDPYYRGNALVLQTPPNSVLATEPGHSNHFERAQKRYPLPPILHS